MEGSNTGPRSGPGRAWGPLRGRSQEINTLARMLRAWVDEAHLGVDGVRDKLTAEHFASGTVPSRATVASRLSGAALQWEFVEAVIDVCSSHVTVAQRRRDQARQVWDQAQLHPTPVPDPAGPAGQRQELARARQRIVQLQGDLAIAQEARDNSRKALADTTNLVSLLWLVIGQLQVRIDQLTRQRDSLQAQTAADAPRLARLHNALQQTQRRQDAAEQEKTAAEAGRSAAKDVAAAADEKYLALQAEVEQLRGTPAAADTSPAVVAGDDVGEAFFEDIDSALDKARAVRERAGQLTHDARADLQALERDEQEGQASEQRRREGAGRDKDQGQGADRDGVRDHDPVSGLPAAPDPLPPRDDTPHQGPGAAWGLRRAAQTPRPGAAVPVGGLSGPDNPPTGQSTPDNAAGPWLAPRTVPDRQPVVAVALSQPFGGDSQALASHAQRAIALVASFGVVGRQRRADELVAAAKLGRLIPPDTLARCIRELRRQGAGVPARWVLITTGWYADPDQLAAAVAALRAAGQQADARTVLFAAGQHRSPYALSQITGQLPHDDIQILLEVASKYRSPTSVLDCLRDFSATGQYTCGRLLAESVGHLRRDEDLPAILDGLHHLHMTAAETWVLQAVARRPAPLRARAHKTLIAAGHSHHVGVLQALQQADAARTPPGTPPDGTAPHRAGAHRAAIASTAPTPPDPAARPLPEPDTGDRPLMDWGFALALIVLGVGLAVVLGLLIWVISM